MIGKLIRWLRGYIVFEIIGGFPERFVNLCMYRGSLVFDIKRDSSGFFASMLLTNYKKIRPIASKTTVRLRIRKRRGLPFILSRYKTRVGLIVGVCLFLIISIVMQSFLWTVEIHGVNTLSESKLIGFLYDEGLNPGSFKGNIDTHKLERRLMSRFPEIGWSSVNIIGTKAEIEIKEKAIKPEIIDYKTPHNVKASMDGLIEKIITKEGTAMVKAGSAVVEGQLLVSSAMENSLEEIDFVHARAEVIATTSRKEVFFVPKSGIYKEPQAPIKRSSLIFCFFTFPISFQSAKGEYTSKILTDKLNYNNTTVEFGVKTEVIIPYEKKGFSLTRDVAREILKTDETLYELFALSNTKSFNVKTKLSQTDEGYFMEAEYTCKEDIAREEIFVVNP